ncbi:rab GTPase-binding effector protein 2 isoform C [Alligator mississippiensis]|uniref:Rab GTPase-binding effector protein 2 n=1 Tax=Alligator mississippiensis TaxID=8496 RepID=A0A151MLY4_ALLMI|nr:rab GTPase-binding effector protein 2 isoform C [Alligator mississippiensis]
MEASLCSVRSEMERLQQALAQTVLVAALDTSEQVQRDFVRLSQALQVRLEQIRQAPSLAEARRVADGAHLDVAAVAPPARDQP